MILFYPTACHNKSCVEILTPMKTIKLTRSDDSTIRMPIKISPYGSDWRTDTASPTEARVYFDQETLVGSFFCKVCTHILMDRIVSHLSCTGKSRPLNFFFIMLANYNNQILSLSLGSTR